MRPKPPAGGQRVRPLLSPHTPLDEGRRDCDEAVLVLGLTPEAVGRELLSNVVEIPFQITLDLSRHRGEKEWSDRATQT